MKDENCRLSSPNRRQGYSQLIPRVGEVHWAAGVRRWIVDTCPVYRNRPGSCWPSTIPGEREAQQGSKSLCLTLSLSFSQSPSQSTRLTLQPSGWG